LDFSAYTEPYGAEQLYRIFQRLQGVNKNKVQLFEPTTNTPTNQTAIRSGYIGYAIMRGQNGFLGVIDVTPNSDVGRYETNPATWQAIKQALGQSTALPTSTLEAGASSYGYRLYKRNFQRGIAYLNFTGKTKTITLPTNRQFKDRNGNPITKLTLGYQKGDYVLYR
jgi:hypothetical protein